MSSDTNTGQSSQRETWRKSLQEPYVALYDEKRRLWGFFMPEGAAMLKSRSPAQWYALARDLLAEHDRSQRLVIIPFDDGRGVRGRFFVTPWLDGPEPAPPQFTPEELAEMHRRATSGKFLTTEEFMAELDRLLQVDE